MLIGRGCSPRRCEGLLCAPGPGCVGPSPTEARKGAARRFAEEPAYTGDMSDSIDDLRTQPALGRAHQARQPASSPAWRSSRRRSTCGSAAPTASAGQRDHRARSGRVFVPATWPTWWCTPTSMRCRPSVRRQAPQGQAIIVVSTTAAPACRRPSGPAGGPGRQLAAPCAGRSPAPPRQLDHLPPEARKTRCADERDRAGGQRGAVHVMQDAWARGQQGVAVRLDLRAATTVCSGLASPWTAPRPWCRCSRRRSKRYPRHAHPTTSERTVSGEPRARRRWRGFEARVAPDAKDRRGLQMPDAAGPNQPQDSRGCADNRMSARWPGSSLVGWCHRRHRTGSPYEQYTRADRRPHRARACRRMARSRKQEGALRAQQAHSRRRNPPSCCASR